MASGMNGVTQPQSGPGVVTLQAEVHWCSKHRGTSSAALWQFVISVNGAKEFPTDRQSVDYIYSLVVTLVISVK